MQKLTFAAFAVFVLLAGAVAAQQSQEVRKLVMEPVWISETKAEIFVVGGVGFNSVASLGNME